MVRRFLLGGFILAETRPRQPYAVKFPAPPFIFVIGALVAVSVLAMVRLTVATRRASSGLRESAGDAELVTAVLGEAVTQIREKERATHARAAASERLSVQIIASLSSGLLVVGVDGEIRILNPVGRRLLGIKAGAAGESLRELGGASVAPLADVIDECLMDQEPIMRRTLVREPRSDAGEATHLGVTVSPMHDDSGIQGAICLFADLSAVVDLE